MVGLVGGGLLQNWVLVELDGVFVYAPRMDLLVDIDDRGIFGSPKAQGNWSLRIDDK